MTTTEHLDPDTDRLLLLDRLAERLPELDLDREEIDWMPLDDGHQALLVNGGGIDGGDGVYFANAGEDVHAVGSLGPIVEGYVGCIVIRPETAVRSSPACSRTRWPSRSRSRPRSLAQRVEVGLGWCNTLVLREGAEPGEDHPGIAVGVDR